MENTPTDDDLGMFLAAAANCAIEGNKYAQQLLTMDKPSLIREWRRLTVCEPGKEVRT